jgi:hypothetical protein
MSKTTLDDTELNYSEKKAVLAAFSYGLAKANRIQGQRQDLRLEARLAVLAPGIAPGDVLLHEERADSYVFSYGGLFVGAARPEARAAHE